MTRRLTIRAAIALSTGLCGIAAAAAEGIKFDFGGFADGAIFHNRQTTSGFFDPYDKDIDALGNGELHLRGSYLTEGGTELGGRIELRLQSGDRSDSTTGRSDAFTLDKAYLWAENGLGRIEIGATDGAAKQLQIEPPSVTKSLRIDHPLMMPVADEDGAYYRPGGLMLRTDLYASDQSAKILYRSPRLIGFQAAISYTPEFSANTDHFVKAAGDDPNQQSEIIELGLNYDSNLSDVRVRADVVYLTANNELKTDTTISFASPWMSGDLSEWGAAASAKYKGFTFGGAYRHSNARGGYIDSAPVVLTGGASDTELWSLGALYEIDSWKIGANYAHGDTHVAVTDALLGGRTAKQRGEGWQIAAAYAVTTDIQISGGYQRYDFDASAGLNPFGLGEFHPANVVGPTYAGDLGADIIFTEFSIGF